MQKKKPNNRVANFSKSDANHKHKNTTKVNNGVFIYTDILTVNELAKQLELNPSDIIKYLFMEKKIMVNINSPLDDDTIGEICLNWGYDFKKEKIVEKERFEEIEIHDDPKDLMERPPVVVIMGHVDHGKTTLIDTIRDSHVAEGEVGLITQQIGAYQKDIRGKKITFLDTPGHEAFAAMRARGASVTDIALIVVAADDGVMPQTKEAIDHARASNVQIIVVINKIDKPTANVEKVKTELANEGIIPEEWDPQNGVIFKEISAKQKIGIDDLLDTILEVSDAMELKANPKRYGFGTVIEASLDKNEGPKATLLVQNGSINIADHMVIGTSYCKVRRMVNEYKKSLKTAGPSTPVVVTGIDEVPVAGDRFMVFPDEKTARDVAAARKLTKRNEELRPSSTVTLDELFSQQKESEQKHINVVLRADLQGSVEALKSSLDKLSVEGIKVNIIRAAAGAISENDILLAATSKAIVYGFNVRPDAIVRQKAAEEHVEIRLHSIIYALTEEIEAAMKGMLSPVEKEVILGTAEIRQLFRASKVGTIAGCMVTSGTLKRGVDIRLIRDGIVIFTGKLGSLRRGKDDVSNVNSGFECGLTIENFNDIKENDVIEAFEMQKVERK